MRTLFTKWLVIPALLALLFAPGQASAVPVLQLYIEGATYDADSETWVLSDPTSSIRLWAIGNVDGPGGQGPITDVKLAISFSSTAGDGLIFNLTPSTTGNLGGFTDFSTPSTPTPTGSIVTDGSAPTLYGGGSLPSHGEFGSDVYWQEFLLGNFTLTDSPMADFIDAFPTVLRPDSGQINVYEITFDGSLEDPLTLHFDLYNHVASGNGRGSIRAVFAPFSHDGNGAISSIPVPPGIVLMAIGGVGLCGYRRFRARLSA